MVQCIADEGCEECKPLIVSTITRSMSKKAKLERPESKHRSDRLEAEKYLWHLHLPWRNKFNHEHWWDENSKPPDGAVVWEILRRHPRAKRILEEKGTKYFQSDLEHFISFNAPLSWPLLGKIDAMLHKSWAKALGELPVQHGISNVDREGIFQVVKVIGEKNLTQLNEISSLGKQHWNSISSGGKIAIREWKRAQMIWNNSAARGGIVGGGINWETFAYLSLGGVLIGFDPNFPGVDKLVQKKIKEIIAAARPETGAPSTKGKSYWKSELKAIKAFEADYMGHEEIHKRDEKLFTPYRNSISKWKWPT
jgi:hypothetical protein